MDAPEKPASATSLASFVAWVVQIRKWEQRDFHTELLQIAHRCATLAWAPWLILFAVPLSDPVPLLLLAAALPLVAASAAVYAWWALPDPPPDTRREALGILIFIDAMTLATAIAFVILARFIKP
jgi:hypothetical protein